jgi:hypothetical protein
LRNLIRARRTIGGTNQHSNWVENKGCYCVISIPGGCRFPRKVGLYHGQVSCAVPVTRPQPPPQAVITLQLAVPGIRLMSKAHT